MEQISYEMLIVLAIAGFAYFVKTANTLFKESVGEKNLNKPSVKFSRAIGMIILLAIFILILYFSGEYIRKT